MCPWDFPGKDTAVGCHSLLQGIFPTQGSNPHLTALEKAKWLSGEALHIAVKRREVKSKGEKEKYKHLNAEFQKNRKKT